MSSSPPGTLLISLDFELAWGYLDFAPGWRAQQPFAREEYAVDALLDLFARHRAPATWFTVGAVALDPAELRSWAMVWEIFQDLMPIYDRRWLPAWMGRMDIPHRYADEAAAWFAPHLIQRIHAAPGQEIGAHSFAHPVLERLPVGEKGEKLFYRDLLLCMDAFKQLGIQPQTYAYPRNVTVPGGSERLAYVGFTSVRDRVDDPWEGRSGIVGKVARAVAAYGEISPKVGTPYRDEHGLVHMPGGVFLTHGAGWARALSVASRVRRVVKGLEAAAASGGVLSLWLHPVNVLGPGGSTVLAALDAILSHATQMRDTGRLRILTMSEATANFVAPPSMSPGGAS